MKNSKIYLLLIAMAFLSFSCDEDADRNQDKTGSGAEGAAKYLFNESKIYTYSLESNIDNQSSTFERNIISSNFEEFEGKNSIFYTNDSNGERYMSAEGDILYGYGTFLVLDYLNKKEWLQMVDLSKQDWVVYSETITNDILNEIDKKELKGKFIKNITFNFKGKVYNGIELQYTSHSSYGFMEKNEYVKIQYKDGTETIWLVDGLGLVKSSIEKYEYFNEFEESNSTTEVILIDIKEK